MRINKRGKTVGKLNVLYRSRSAVDAEWDYEAVANGPLAVLQDEIRIEILLRLRYQIMTAVQQLHTQQMDALNWHLHVLKWPVHVIINRRLHHTVAAAIFASHLQTTSSFKIADCCDRSSMNSVKYIATVDCDTADPVACSISFWR